MASRCPKCQQFVEDDIICCAGLKQNWKCRACGKLTQGFVVPFGRCFLCGGALEVVTPYDHAEVGGSEALRDALRYELEMYHFYRPADGPVCLAN